MAMPPAAITAPTSVPMPSGVAQSPVHWIRTNWYPMNPPIAPPTTIDTNAASRAAGAGSADSGRSESLTRPCYDSVRVAELLVVGPRAWLSVHAEPYWVASAPMRVTVVVPTYNEVDNVDALLRGVRHALPAARILVVDDGSPDGTADRAEALADELGELTVLRRTTKDGLGAAYRAGLGHAIADGAEVCVQMDADLSHDPDTLPALVAIVEHGADLAIGSRYVPGGITLDWPRRRRWVSRWGNRYAAGVLGLAINDATAGFRAYRSDALRSMRFDEVRAEGYGFQIEMTYRIVRLGGKCVEFPITFRDRTEGVSKFSGSIVREAFGLVLRLWVADFSGRRQRRALGG
jgi:dolichol-phosphate mannosyltransferase